MEKGGGDEQRKDKKILDWEKGIQNTSHRRMCMLWVLLEFGMPRCLQEALLFF